MTNKEMTDKILNHIKKKDPELWGDKCYYLNQEDMPDLLKILKYYYYEKLQWCGCGSPGSALQTIGKYLEARNIKEWPADVKKMKELFPPDGDENSLVLCLAYELDRADFTDHGSSIFSCWLTEDGEYLLWAIKEAENLEILNEI